MKNISKNLLILNLLCSSIILCGCNENIPNTENNNNEKNDDKKDDSKKDDNTDKDEDNDKKDDSKVTITTIQSTDFTTLQSAKKMTDGQYLLDDVEEKITDFTFTFTKEITGISKNEDYLNQIMVKKNNEGSIILSSTKTITKIVLTTNKKTQYDTLYGKFELKNNESTLDVSEEVSKGNNNISKIDLTYTLDSKTLTGDIIFNSDPSRAIYLSTITIYSK